MRKLPCTLPIPLVPTRHMMRQHHPRMRPGTQRSSEIGVDRGAVGCRDGYRLGNHAFIHVCRVYVGPPLVPCRLGYRIACYATDFDATVVIAYRRLTLQPAPPPPRLFLNPVRHLTAGSHGMAGAATQGMVSGGSTTTSVIIMAYTPLASHSTGRMSKHPVAGTAKVITQTSSPLLSSR